MVNITTDKTDYTQLEQAIEESLEQRDFHFMYQPILNTKGGGIALEMLARWNYEGKYIPPNVFIPMLEEIGLIHKLNCLMIDQLVEDRSILDKRIPELSFLSINVSPFIFKSAKEEEFLEYLEEKLAAHDISRESVCLEITESALVDSPAIDFLNRCRQRGFLIAIDDFGSGYSSFAYLVGHSFNILKLDIDLIRQITTNERKQTITESVIQMAKRLSIRVVAEGVESEDQLYLLKRMGADDVQGYLLGKPALITNIDANKVWNHRSLNITSKNFSVGEAIESGDQK